MKHIKELTEYIDERDYKTLSSLQFLKSLKDNTVDKITYDWDSEIRKNKPDQSRLTDFVTTLCDRLRQIGIDEDRISEMNDEFIGIIQSYSKASNRVPHLNNTGSGYFPENDYTPTLNGAGFGDVNEGGEVCNVIKTKTKKKKMKHLKKYNEQKVNEASDYDRAEDLCEEIVNLINSKVDLKILNEFELRTKLEKLLYQNVKQTEHLKEGYQIDNEWDKAYQDWLDNGDTMTSDGLFEYLKERYTLTKRGKNKKR